MSGEAGTSSPGAGPPKKANRRNLRKKRNVSSDSEGEDGTAGVLSAKRKQLDSSDKNAMSFTTKKQHASTNATVKSVMTFESTAMDAKPEYLTNDATRTLDMGAQASGLPAGQDAPESSTQGGANVYRGMKGYKDYRDGFRREDEKGGKQGPVRGPMKPSANYRMSVLVDYQPDICKDYKETGYCGFGDSCKFLHDRGDYKAGWQLDRDWEEEQKARKERERKGWVDASESEEDSDDDGLPFACFICREPWSKCQDPVVTKCGHHFCEQCALKQNAKSGKCFVCNEPTRGIFNVAHDIIKRERQRAKH